MKKILTFILCLASFAGFSQGYWPSKHIAVNDAIAPAQKVPIDARWQYYDTILFAYRDFQSPGEVLSTYSNSTNRYGHPFSFIRFGGTLSGANWIGGTTQLWWFKNGVADSNLVRIYTDSVGIPQNLIDSIWSINDSTFGFQELSGYQGNILIRGTAAGGISSLSLNVPTSIFLSPVTFTNTGGPWVGTMLPANQSSGTFLAGPPSGGIAQPSFRGIATSDLPTGIPNGNLANSSINLFLDNTGSVPSFGTTPVALGATLVLHLPWASASTGGPLTASDWIRFNSVTTQSVISVNGQTGVVVAKNADSLASYPINFSNYRNGWVLAWDTVAEQFVFNSPFSGTGITSLNGLAVSSQNFATGYSGTSPNISSTGATHTFNNPIVNGADTGLVTPALYNLWNLAKDVGVDSVWRTPGKDSIQYAINGRYHSILDSAGGGITGGAGLIPLFTNGVSGSTLTFILSNAMARSVFGDSSASTGAPVYYVPTLATLNGWASGSIALLGASQTFTGANTFNGGIVMGSGISFATDNTYSIGTSSSGANNVWSHFFSSDGDLGLSSGSSNRILFNAGGGTVGIFASTGQLQLSKYITSTTFTGTPTSVLEVDASGNIIQGSLSTGCSNCYDTLFVLPSDTAVVFEKGNGIKDTISFTGFGGGGISLTTIGSSGPATLVGTVLNIPQYSGSQTLQQTLTIGSTVTGSNTITNNGTLTFANAAPTGVFKFNGLSHDSTNSVGLFGMGIDSSMRMLPWASIGLKIVQYLPRDTTFFKRGIYKATNSVVWGNPFRLDSSVYIDLGNQVGTLNNTVTFDSVGAGFKMNGIPQAAAGKILVHMTDSSFAQLTLGTNLSIGAGGVLNASGGGGSQTFQQTLTTGRTLANADSVLLNSFSLHFKGGYINTDTVKSYVSGTVDTTKIISGFGTSVMEGVGATNARACWFNLSAARMKLTANNQGDGGYTLSNPPGTSVPSFLNTYTTQIPTKDAAHTMLVFAWGENDPTYNQEYCCSVLDYSVARFISAYNTVLTYAESIGWDTTNIIIASNIVQSYSSASAIVQDSFYNAELGVAAAYHLKFVDLYHPSQTYLPYDKVDYVHPSDWGHANIANNFLSQIDSLLTVKNNGQNVAVNGLGEFKQLQVTNLLPADTNQSQLVVAQGNGLFATVPSDRFVKLGSGQNQQTGNININDTAFLGHLKVTGRSDLQLLVTSVDAIINNTTVGHGLGSYPSNTALGNNVLTNNAADNANTAIGSGALQDDNTGFFNTAIGYSALNSLQSGNENTAIGVQALNDVTGSGNVGIGSQAGTGLTAISNKLIIANSATNNLIYGDFSANQVQINGGVTAAFLSSDNFIDNGSSYFSDSVILHNVRNGLTTDSVAVLHQLSSGEFVIHKVAQSSIGGGSGVTTVGTFDGGTANSNGLYISGTSIFAQSASVTNPGMINTTTQSIAGNKTMTGVLAIGNTYTSNGAAIFIGGNTTASQSSAGGAGSILSTHTGLTNLDGNATGTSTQMASVSLVGQTFNATNAQTYTALSTLQLSAPTAGTNVSLSTPGGPFAIYVSSGNSYFVGSLSAFHFIGNSTAPTIAAGAGAGSGPTVTIAGTDQSGLITVVTGTTPTGLNAIIATITYNLTYPNTTYVSLTPANATAALVSGATMVYTNGGATTFTINAGTTGLPTGTYIWAYSVGGK